MVGSGGAGLSTGSAYNGTGADSMTKKKTSITLLIPKNRDKQRHRDGEGERLFFQSVF